MRSILIAISGQSVLAQHLPWWGGMLQASVAFRHMSIRSANRGRHALMAFCAACVAVCAPLSVAHAQLYPMPYAISEAEHGQPPYSVSEGGYMAAGGRVYNGAHGFYDKSYADRAAQYLNEMADASNRCDRKAYNAALDRYTLLQAEADARDRGMRAKRTAAAEAYNTAAHKYEMYKEGDKETVQKLGKKFDQTGQDELPVLRDILALTDLTKPPYDDRHCAPPTNAAAPPPPQVGMVTPGVIPAPPGQAQQNLNQPDCATDPASGQGLRWDPNQKSWVNTATAQAVGYQGITAQDGTVIPAPPAISGRTGGSHQAHQDTANPESAYDSITGQHLQWDRTRNTWFDTKTGNAVGFQGASVSSATPVGLPSCGVMNAAPPTGTGFGFGFGVGGFGSGGTDRSDESDRSQPYRQSSPKKP